MHKKIIEDINNLPKISEVIKTYNLSAKSFLSQNFILDIKLTTHISQLSGSLKEKSVIEIGPGPGALTRSLIINGAKKIITIEKDKRFIKALRPLKDIVDERLIILNEDALKICLSNIIYHYKLKNPVIISNLPYSIGTKLLIKWLPLPKEIKKMTLMFQKEVAERIVAKKGTKKYGRLAVITNLYSRPKILMRVSRKAFFPKPKVDSAIVEIEPKAKNKYKFKKNDIEKITHLLFHLRRKKIKSSLKSLGNPEEICRQAKLDCSLRAEQISPEEFALLAEILSSRLN